MTGDIGEAFVTPAVCGSRSRSSPPAPLWGGSLAWCFVADDVFARVARWWDREAELAGKRALLGYINADIALAGTWWEDLDGQLRWRVVEAMRAMTILRQELQTVLER
jgi:hypothetical protein